MHGDECVVEGGVENLRESRVSASDQLRHKNEREGTNLLLDVVTQIPAVNGGGVNDREGDVSVGDHTSVGGGRGDVRPACEGTKPRRM